MDSTAEFCARMREAMARQGMTQAELARRLDVRDATVSDWFNRGALPSGAVMLRLPEVLRVDGHWLLTGEDAARDGGRRGAIGGDDRREVVRLLESALRIARAGEDGGAPRKRAARPDA